MYVYRYRCCSGGGVVGGFWLNHRRIIWSLTSSVFYSITSCKHLISDPPWYPSGSPWVQIHIHWPSWSSGSFVVFIQKEPGVKISTVYPYIPSLDSTRPSIHPSSLHTEHIPNEQNTMQCWTIILKPLPFNENIERTNFAPHRFHSFLEGPVWQGTIALQTWEGPFCPKISSNLTGQCKWSISSWSDPLGHVSQKAPSAVGGTL